MGFMAGSERVLLMGVLLLGVPCPLLSSPAAFFLCNPRVARFTLCNSNPKSTSHKLIRTLCAGRRSTNAAPAPT